MSNSHYLKLAWYLSSTSSKQHRPSSKAWPRCWRKCDILPEPKSSYACWERSHMSLNSSGKGQINLSLQDMTIFPPTIRTSFPSSLNKVYNPKCQAHEKSEERCNITISSAASIWFHQARNLQNVQTLLTGLPEGPASPLSFALFCSVLPQSTNFLSVCDVGSLASASMKQQLSP